MLKQISIEVNKFLEVYRKKWNKKDLELKEIISSLFLLFGAAQPQLLS